MTVPDIMGIVGLLLIAGMLAYWVIKGNKEYKTT